MGAVSHPSSVGGGRTRGVGRVSASATGAGGFVGAGWFHSLGSTGGCGGIVTAVAPEEPWGLEGPHAAATAATARRKLERSTFIPPGYRFAPGGLCLVSMSERPSSILSFGGRIPWAVGLLLVLTAGASLAAAVASRHVAPLFAMGDLAPAAIRHGEAWRLVTWPLLETSLLSLVFVALALLWFGRDLAEAWGSRRLLAAFAGLGVFSGAATTLLGLLDPAIDRAHYTGGSAVAAGLLVAWGLTFPDRVVRIFFVLPLSGRAAAWLTVLAIGGWTAYAGWDTTAPWLASSLGALGWLFRSTVGARFLAMRRAAAARAARAAHDERERRRRLAAAQVRELDRAMGDDDLPPMPKEIEAQIAAALRGAGKEREREPSGNEGG